MSSSVKSSKLLPAHGMELLILIDDFGSEKHLYLSVHDSANRQSNIDAELKAMDEHVERLRAYAQQHNVPLQDE